jgi:hypothetical protein
MPTPAQWIYWSRQYNTSEERHRHEIWKSIYSLMMTYDLRKVKCYYYRIEVGNLISFILDFLKRWSSYRRIIKEFRPEINTNALYVLLLVQ